MREDLLDAQAAVDWAVIQLEIFQGRIIDWIKTSPCIARTEKDPQGFQNVWRIEFIRPAPRILNAEAGAIINSIRSSLDLLANALATRNGNVGEKDVYFPVCACQERWGGKHGAAKKIKRLSAADRQVIEGLQPYHEGDQSRLLYLLHKMDLARKHRELLEFSTSTPGVAVMRATAGIGNLDAFFPLDEGYSLAPTPANPDYQVHVRIEVTLSDAGILEHKPIKLAIHELATLANGIIALFDQ